MAKRIPAAAALIGKRNTEMIPLLIKSREETEGLSRSMGIMSTETVENTNKAYQDMQRFQNELVVGIAETISKLQNFDDFMNGWSDRVHKSLYKAGLAFPGKGDKDLFEAGGGSFGGRGAGSSWDEPSKKGVGAAGDGDTAKPLTKTLSSSRKIRRNSATLSARNASTRKHHPNAWQRFKVRPETPWRRAMT